MLDIGTRLRRITSVGSQTIQILSADRFRPAPNSGMGSVSGYTIRRELVPASKDLSAKSVRFGWEHNPQTRSHSPLKDVEH
jgi:hypothetical protein